MGLQNGIEPRVNAVLTQDMTTLRCTAGHSVAKSVNVKQRHAYMNGRDIINVQILHVASSSMSDTFFLTIKPEWRQ